MLNKKIEYFVTLAECLSFTQAAAAHSVSQTAISQYIASLEAKLQVRLFNRNAHAVSLTDAGKFFYERVTFMLRYESDTKKRLIAIAEQYSGYVKVGIGMYESRHTEDFFSRFLLSHPEIKVDIFQYPYGALTEKLKSGELDVILANVLCEKAFAKEEILSRPMFESFNYLGGRPLHCREVSPWGRGGHASGRVPHHQLRRYRPQLHGNAPTNAPAGIRGGAGALRPDQQHQRPDAHGPCLPRHCHCPRYCPRGPGGQPSPHQNEHGGNDPL